MTEREISKYLARAVATMLLLKEYLRLPYLYLPEHSEKSPLYPL